MEKLQLCNMCRKNIAFYSCKSCGRSICANCYDKGFCIDCKIGKHIKR